MSTYSQRLLSKLEANQKLKGKKKYEIITISSLLDGRSYSSGDKITGAIKDLMAQNLVTLKEARIEGRFENEIVLIPKIYCNDSSEGSPSEGLTINSITDK
jgi:hypothetical protein